LGIPDLYHEVRTKKNKDKNKKKKEVKKRKKNFSYQKFVTKICC